jgi:hypothetical protein
MLGSPSSSPSVEAVFDEPVSADAALGVAGAASGEGLAGFSFPPVLPAPHQSLLARGCTGVTSLPHLAGDPMPQIGAPPSPH